MMKYALAVRTKVVPEWKFCYYDYKTLSKLVQILQKLSSIKDSLGSRLIQESQCLLGLQLQKIKRRIIQITLCMHQVNRMFFRSRDCEMQVIYVFSQMKEHELRRKFDFYQLISANSPLDDKNTLTLYENIYIQCGFLLTMLDFTLRKEERVLDLQRKIVDKYIQFDVPNIDSRKVQRLRRRVRNLCLSMQEATLHHHSQKPKKVRRNLREMRNFYLQLHSWSFLGFGFWCGVLLSLLFCILIVIIWSGINVDSYQKFAIDFPIWRGLSYFVLYFWVIGLDVLFFEYHEINYKLLFHFDTSNMPSSTFVLIASAIFTSIYLLLFGLYIGQMGELIELSTNQLKAIAWLIIFVYLVLPLPILQYRGRLYFAKLFVFMLSSPLLGADFKMHWLCEQFTSLKQPLQDMVYTIYYYSYGIKSYILPQTIFLGTLIGIFFFVLRILQGIKTGITNGKYFSTPLFKGAFKCTFNICTLLASYFYNVNPSDLNLTLWIISAVWSTLYAYHFDLRYDWGLLQFDNEDHPLLRKKRIIQNANVYYFCMVLNFFMRIAWVLTISSGLVEVWAIQPYLFTMAISWIEIFRRGMWNIFRIQFQHVLNCARFNAIIDYKKIEQAKVQEFIGNSEHRATIVKAYRNDKLYKVTNQAQIEFINLSIEANDKCLKEVQSLLVSMQKRIIDLEKDMDINYF